MEYVLLKQLWSERFAHWYQNRNSTQSACVYMPSRETETTLVYCYSRLLVKCYYFVYIILMIITFHRKCVLSWNHYHEIYGRTKENRFWLVNENTHSDTHITHISSNRSGCICNFFLIVDTLRGGFWMCATSWNEKPIWINTNQSEQSSKWGLQPMATHNNRIENNKKIVLMKIKSYWNALCEKKNYARAFTDKPTLAHTTFDMIVTVGTVEGTALEMLSSLMRVKLAMCNSWTSFTCSNVNESPHF